MAIRSLVRYHEVQSQFLEWANAVQLYPEKPICLAAMQGRFLLALHFAEKARTPVNEAGTQWLIHQDWRTTPKQRIPWRARVGHRKLEKGLTMGTDHVSG